jgi:hypothetical protein
MKPKFRILSLILALIMLILTVGCSENKSEEYKIPVLLTVPDGVTIDGEGSVYALPGESVSFKLTLGSGYSVVDTENDGYSFADGVLTIDPVYYPTTVDLVVSFDINDFIQDENAGNGEMFVFDCKAVGLSGTASASVDTGAAAKGTKITVAAQAYENRRFVCWSIGASLMDGGKPVSTDAEYTFNIDQNTVLYANFASGDGWTVIYDGNGGTTDEGKGLMRQDITKGFYLCPHTLASEGQLARDGYVLYAYNTEPDGSGKEYTFGSNIVMPESDTIILYAMWQKVDNEKFSFGSTSGGLTVIKCNDNSSVVAVPETHGGKKVVGITTGAFSGLDKLETLILPSGITKVDKESINNCKLLSTIYLGDKIIEMPDTFYKNCPLFKTVKIGATRPPVYSTTRNGTYAVKFQRLITATGDKLVIVGGSSSYYGTDSELIEKKLEGKYSIVNYGTNQETPSVLFVDMVTDFIDEKDVVLLVPEPNRKQYGGNEMTLICWQLFEGAFEALSYVDVSNMAQFFSTFATFNTTRNNMPAKSYEQYSKKNGVCEMNTHGDCVFYRAQNKAGWNYGKDTSFTRTKPSTSDFARINAAINAIKAKGAYVYLSFSTYNIDGLNATNKSDTTLNNYANMIKTNVKATIITDVKDYMYTGEYYYDTNKHLTTLGVQKRSEHLAERIKSQLQKDGLW